MPQQYDHEADRLLNTFDMRVLRYRTLYDPNTREEVEYVVRMPLIECRCTNVGCTFWFATVNHKLLKKLLEAHKGVCTYGEKHKTESEPESTKGGCK